MGQPLLFGGRRPVVYPGYRRDTGRTDMGLMEIE